MDAKVKAVIYRALVAFLVGFALVAIPLLQATYKAGLPAFNGQDFLWALFGGIIAGVVFAIEKVLAPVLLPVLADPGQTGPVLPVTSMPLKDVQPTPTPTPGMITPSPSGIGAEAAVKTVAPLEPQTTDPQSEPT